MESSSISYSKRMSARQTVLLAALISIPKVQAESSKPNPTQINTSSETIINPLMQLQGEVALKS